MSWISWQDSSAGNRAQRVISVAMIHLRNGKSVGTRTPWFLFIILRIPANAYTQASISRAHLRRKNANFCSTNDRKRGFLKRPHHGEMDESKEKARELGVHRLKIILIFLSSLRWFFFYELNDYYLRQRYYFILNIDGIFLKNRF